VCRLPTDLGAGLYAGLRAELSGERISASGRGPYATFFPGSKVNTIINTAPTVIAESAMLNAGQR
jgi:hypothetical protein